MGRRCRLDGSPRRCEIWTTKPSLLPARTPLPPGLWFSELRAPSVTSGRTLPLAAPVGSTAHASSWSPEHATSFRIASDPNWIVSKFSESSTPRVVCPGAGDLPVAYPEITSRRQSILPCPKTGQKRGGPARGLVQALHLAEDLHVKHDDARRPRTRAGGGHHVLVAPFGQGDAAVDGTTPIHRMETEGFAAAGVRLANRRNADAEP